MNCARHRVKVIDNFEPGFFAKIVDAGDINQVIEQKFVAAKCCDLTKIVCGNLVSRLTAKLSLVLNLLFKLRLTSRTTPGQS